MLTTSVQETEWAVLSLSVQSWFRHYKAKPDDKTSEIICSAAIDLFNRGHRTQEELTSILIARFPLITPAPAALH
ncbi:hypothetical protein [Rhizobium etli]|uniref:hypothetical protein n=1 Tax=Rhizobium etli TaxID=29449 RepID=UPI0003839438|nr:hypothetical protein [Rhizobium etli]AGS21427.1 hypothetical protein REMIM1_CH01597 [Rhizobium etli bv. mimosae str. Mim1]